MTNSPAESQELERAMVRALQQLESGRDVDWSWIHQEYAHLEKELSDFIQMHQRFEQAALSAKEGLSTNPSSAALDHSGSGAPLLQPMTEVPQSLGPYQILDEVDRGGMGVVYRARHVGLNRVVALKLIRSGELASAEEVQRFQTEAAAAAAMNHPGIVPIYEVGELQGHHYYTMAYIDGESLASVLRQGPMEKQRALKVLIKLCKAVQHAHQLGVFHRDLKPANILLDANDQPIIIDFGLARVINRDSELTLTGQVLGTPAYMAPERAQGRISPGPSEDIYALGAIAYYMLSGQPAFSGPTPFDVLIQVLDSEPAKPSKLQPGLNRQVDYLCLKALDKDPALRYASASDMEADLLRLLSDETIDLRQYRLSELLSSWWNREPMLVSHVSGIGATIGILCLTFMIAGGNSVAFTYRMILLAGWMATCFPLQRLTRYARYRDLACTTWITLDVVLYTWLISFAEPPRSLLLIGYPMMIVASSLFYRSRFVIYTTICCITGFISLVFLFPRRTYEGLDIDEQFQGAKIQPDYVGLDIDFFRYEYAGIFLSGMLVICLTLLSVIRRIRRLSLFSAEAS